MNDELVFNNFEHLIDNEFYAIDTEGTHYLFVLTEAEKYPKLPPEKDFPGRKREAFYLVFKGPKNFHFQQGNVELHHDAFKKPILMLLVALGKNKEDPERLEFQATFN